MWDDSRADLKAVRLAYHWAEWWVGQTAESSAIHSVVRWVASSDENWAGPKVFHWDD